MRRLLLDLDEFNAIRVAVFQLWFNVRIKLLLSTIISWSSAIIIIIHFPVLMGLDNWFPLKSQLSRPNILFCFNLNASLLEDSASPTYLWHCLFYWRSQKNGNKMENSQVHSYQNNPLDIENQIIRDFVRHVGRWTGERKLDEVAVSSILIALAVRWLTGAET